MHAGLPVPCLALERLHEQVLERSLQTAHLAFAFAAEIHGDSSACHLGCNYGYGTGARAGQRQHTCEHHAQPGSVANVGESAVAVDGARAGAADSTSAHGACPDLRHTTSVNEHPHKLS
jgi:hypothetical protein